MRLVITRALGLVMLTFGSANNLMALDAGTCASESEVPSTTPAERFIDNGDGTVTDKATGLMWMKCVLGKTGNSCAGEAASYTWEEALVAADSNVFAGYANWRLPNIKELHTIVEYRCYLPSINSSLFPSTPESFHWSSTPYDNQRSYGVYFSNGASEPNDKTQLWRVRLVRDFL